MDHYSGTGRRRPGTTGSSQNSQGNSWKSTSGTGRKWGVPPVQGGSGEYLGYREEVGSTLGTGRKWGVPQVQRGSGEYLRWEKVGREASHEQRVSGE